MCMYTKIGQAAEGHCSLGHRSRIREKATVEQLNDLGVGLRAFLAFAEKYFAAVYSVGVHYFHLSRPVILGRTFLAVMTQMHLHPNVNHVEFPEAPPYPDFPPMIRLVGMSF